MAAVSIIVPVYNVEKYLGDCLDSILKQDFEDMEIICVNDGSTDRSLPILENYREKDDRIIIVSQKNSGLAQARNKGLRYAMGKYVCFVDSDDMLAEGALQSLYDTAEHYRTQIVSCEADVLYESEAIKAAENKGTYYDKSRQYSGLKSGKEYFVEMMENDDYCDSACLLFLDREWLSDCGTMFYPGIYFEDVLFCLDCLWNAEKMFHLSRKNYIYRVRERSIMTSSPHFINVYSCIVNYRETMRMLLHIDDSEERLQAALVKYMRRIAGRIRSLDSQCGEEERNESLSPMDSLLEYCFEVGKERPCSRERLLLLGLEKLVEDNGKIVLYGAGKIGKLVLAYLRDRHLSERVLCFAVSDVTGSPSEVCGLPVWDIAQISGTGSFVLLTAGGKFRKEMIRNLERLGIRNYEEIDGNMELTLERCLRQTKGSFH